MNTKEAQAYIYILNCMQRARASLVRSESFDNDEEHLILSIEGLLKQLITRNSNKAIDEQPETVMPAETPTQPMQQTQFTPPLTNPLSNPLTERQKSILNTAAPDFRGGNI